MTTKTAHPTRRGSLDDYVNNATQDEQTLNRRFEPDELAFAFCFDVLASAGSMGLAAVYSLLSPWGWTQATVFERLRELQDEGLVILVNTSSPDKPRRGEVRVTIEGEKVSNAHGIGSYRLRNQTTNPRYPSRGAALTGERPRTNDQ